MLKLFEGLVAPAADIIGKVVQDKDEAARLAHEIATMAEKNEHAVRLAQIAVNKAEAESASLFKGGWRPFIGWTCGVALAYHFIGQPMILFFVTLFGVTIPPLPEFDMATLYTLVTGMLGLIGARSFDKTKGVASK